MTGQAIRAKMSRRQVDKSELADEQEVRAVWALYHDFFERVGAAQVELGPRPDQQAMARLDADGDMGVSQFASVPTETLQHGLQFVDGRAPNWCELRHDDAAISSWDPAHAAKFSAPSPCVRPLALLWHQLVGVSAMAAHMWREKAEDDVPGMVLADAVGIGKTAQVMGLIALTQQVFMAEQEAKPRPPLIGE